MIYSEDDHDLLMDRAYEDNKTRALAEEHGFNVVVPPKKNRKDPWEYDKELYKKRNQVERYFLRIKRFRKVFTRYDKLDSIFLSVIMLAMIFDALFMRTRSRTVGISLVLTVITALAAFPFPNQYPIRYGSIGSSACG